MKKKLKELKNIILLYGFLYLINLVKLGEITTLLGSHSLNISSVEMKEKSKEYINFKFNLNYKRLEELYKFYQ